MATTARKHGARGLGLTVIIFGIIFVVAGAVTWGAVSSNLAKEKITVSADAKAFQGQLVDTPWEAWVQADIINHHALASTDGKTYAELAQDDPKRETVMTASFLRASLFTSVVAFGVGLLVVGIGVVLLLVGFALRRLSAVDVVEEVDQPLVAPRPDPVVATAATAPPAPAAPVTAPPAAPTAVPTAAAAGIATSTPPSAAPASTAEPTVVEPPAPSGGTHAAPPDPVVETREGDEPRA